MAFELLPEASESKESYGDVARRSRSDSTEARVAAFQGQDEEVPVPAGITLDDYEEIILWRQFTSARRKVDWRDYDLIIVSKMVKLEMEIRRLNKIVAREGATVEDRFGGEKENPALTARKTLQAQQLQLGGHISLGLGGKNAASRNDGARRKPGRPPGSGKGGAKVTSLLAG